LVFANVVTENLLQYGAIGLLAAIFGLAIIVIDKRLELTYKKLLTEKDKRIEELEKRVEACEEEAQQGVRDTHEVITELNKTVAALLDVAIGFRALVNYLVENKKGGN
jgi:F0F1-type ATP synthase membrane subunit b/b'